MHARWRVRHDGLLPTENELSPHLWSLRRASLSLLNLLILQSPYAAQFYRCHNRLNLSSAFPQGNLPKSSLITKSCFHFASIICMVQNMKAWVWALKEKKSWCKESLKPSRVSWCRTYRTNIFAFWTGGILKGERSDLQDPKSCAFSSYIPNFVVQKNQILGFSGIKFKNDLLGAQDEIIYNIGADRCSQLLIGTY